MAGVIAIDGCVRLMLLPCYDNVVWLMFFAKKQMLNNMYSMLNKLIVSETSNCIQRCMCL